MNLIAISLSLVYLVLNIVTALIVLKSKTATIYFSQLFIQLAIKIPSNIWILFLVYSFYSYLRDRQLWKEGRVPPMQQNQLEANAPMVQRV
ncbi:unnamed protein product, partial [Mesorhabditis belari]|uniref:Uncharacterized protein n=1 Tax=Mesorhabditis belari TaxID=2138241 RepID=A0AAF3F602_9BILA